MEQGDDDGAGAPPPAAPPAGDGEPGAPKPSQPLAFGLAAAPAALHQKRRLAAPIRSAALGMGDDAAAGSRRQEQPEAQLITAIDASGRVVVAADNTGNGDGNGAGPKPPRGPLVIPALPNTYRGPAGGGGKFVPSFVPPSTAGDGGDATVASKFVAAAAPSDEAARRAAAGARYGLELRAGAGGGASTSAAAAGAAGGSAAAAAPAPPQQPPAALPERQRLEHDLRSLPEPAPREAYEALPVEEFGKALLRGLGWSEGQGLGRKRQKVELKEPVMRPERLGLGADPSAAMAAAQAAQAARPRKMGDPVAPPPGVAAAAAGGAAAGGGDGGRGERRDEEAQRRGGSDGGRPHESSRRDRERDRERHGRRHDRHDRDHRSSSSHRRHRSRSRSRSPPPARGPPPRCWLLPGIRVRVVDRRADGGRAYRLKGDVVEVHPGPCADVALDPAPEDRHGRRRVLPLVPQEGLETVVPRAAGGAVVVLRGERRGERATLLDARPEAGVAAVQLADDLSVLRLSLDDFAEVASGGGLAGGGG